MVERQIGDRVVIVADNYGEYAVSIKIQESEDSLPSHYKVGTEISPDYRCSKVKKRSVYSREVIP